MAPNKQAGKKVLATLAAVAVVTTGISGLSLIEESKVDQASAASPVAAMGVIAEHLGTALEFEALGGPAGFLVDALGLNSMFPDPTGEQLKAIEAKEDQISDQIEAVQKSMDALADQVSQLSNQVDHNAMSAYFLALSDTGVKLKDLHEKHLQRVITKAADVRAAADAYEAAKGTVKEADALGALEDARDDLKSSLTGPRGFTAAYEAALNEFDAMPEQLHNRLMPNSSYDSVLKVKGKVLMDDGFVTSADSDQLRAAYTATHDLEALATVLSREYYRAIGDDANAKRVGADYQKWTAQELAVLPEAVPAGVIIQTPTPTTVGAAQWMPAGYNLPDTATHITPDMMRRRDFTAGEWVVPTPDQLLALAKATGKTADASDATSMQRLANLGNTDRWSKYLTDSTKLGWTSQTTSRDVHALNMWGVAGTSASLPVLEHVAVSLNTTPDRTTSALTPAIGAVMSGWWVENQVRERGTDVNYMTMSRLQGYVASQENQLNAGVILVSTSATNYMAQ